jgi:hypothetical protein
MSAATRSAKERVDPETFETAVTLKEEEGLEEFRAYRL